MSFELFRATVEEDLQRVRMISSAFRKTGKLVVLVPLGRGIHAGHRALIRAARAHRGAIVVVAIEVVSEEDRALLEAEKVDLVYAYGVDGLARPRTLVLPRDHGLAPIGSLSAELTAVITLIGRVSPSVVVMGEKDYELLVCTSAAICDLGLNVRVQGVPTVRTADGLAMSLRNVRVPKGARERAAALSAALTAGAHAAERGAQAVLEAAEAVLKSAGIRPEYLELRGARDLGAAPVEGDARLFVAANIGGVLLTDNVGLPLGIGFRNIASQ